MRAQRLRRRRALALAAVALGSAAIALAAYGADLLHRQELSTVDARFSIRGDQPAPDDLAVVQIDARTFDQLRKRWPFPRHLHSEVIDTLRRDGARAIAYDVQFTEPTTPPEDSALIRAVERARGKIVLATTEVDAHGDSGIFGGHGILREIGARPGNALVSPDSDGVLRKMPISLNGLGGFAVVAAETAGRESGGSLGEGDGSYWVDYRGPPGTIPAYSFSRVLRGEVTPGAFRGKVVVVGAEAPTLQDNHTTPTSGSTLMSGPEVQANAIWTAEHGFPLGPAPGRLEVLLILLMAIVAPFASWRLKPMVAMAVAIALGAAFAVFAQLDFEDGQIVTVVYPLLALVLASFGALAVSTLVSAFERQWVHDTFARFVPEAVVDDVLARTDENRRLGAVRCVVTVMFSDLRGFTTFSESRPPDVVLECLNRHMTEMSEAIMAQGGTLVAYLGDGILAVFGTPIEQPDHADRALAASREMVFERLPRFNAWMRENGFGEGFQMGIGLNSGEIMSGQVGSERRMEYTVIGDTANTAARLEGMTKSTPHSIFVAEETRALLQGDDGVLEYVDELPIRGRQGTIKVWTLPEDGDG